jgi:DNA-binding response OmpR family regulator
MLPDGGGHEVLCHVKRWDLPVAVAVVTASGRESLRVAEAIALGADAVFCKPVLFDQIETWLRQMVGR